MSYKWDDKLIEKFLTLYRKHKCLWNPYSPNYRNCSVKNEAFKIVIQELNIPKIRISECLQQIEIIREKYKKEQLKAEKELKSGKLYTSKVPWFKLMSQMLCEVINDEENFSEDPVRFLPCNVTKGEQNKTYEKSPDFLYKPEKYIESKAKQDQEKAFVRSKRELEHIESGLKKPANGQSRNNNLQHESITVNDASGLWNRCPSCGWEEENLDKKYDGANQFSNFKESGVQIDPEIEIPRRIDKTQIFDTNKNIEQVNRLIPPLLCIDETNYSNRELRTPEKDVLQNRKKVQINAEMEPSRSKKCNATEDEVPNRDDDKATKSLKVMSLKENNVHCPRSNNKFEKNIIMCRSHIDGNDRSQFVENEVPNFEMNQYSHHMNKPTANLVLYQDNFARQSQKILESEDERDGKKNISVNRYNSYIEQFGESTTQLSTTSVEDKYEVCSRFKIIIPSSDQEDQNLEITGYEVRVINPQLSKYMICPRFEKPKVAIGNTECACQKEFSVPSRNSNVDPARYSNIIKLDINQKRSKERRAKKRLRDSGTTCTRQQTDFENDCVFELDARHKSFSNKKTQTDSYNGNKSIPVLRDMEKSKFDSSKSVKDQGCTMDVLSMNGKSCCGRTPKRNENWIEQHRSTMINDTLVSQNPQIENSLSPAGQFNNTRILLNVIIKILESDDTDERSENLQTTLDTMLNRFQEMSMAARSTTEYHKNNNSDAAYNNTSMSTEYQNIALNSAPTNRQAKTFNSEKSTYKTVELDNMTQDFRPQSPILGETNNTVNEEAGGSQRDSGSLNETNKSTNERGTRNGPFVSLLDDTNASNLANSSILDYTNDFSNEEPVASSSRKIRERRRPSELTKDFLNVLKYTMMMDGILQQTENGNNDCCTKPNESTNPQHRAF